MSNLSENGKVRFALVTTLIGLQILSVSIFRDVIEGNLFLAVHFGYIAVGCLSIHFWQALKNFVSLTIPCAFLIALLLLTVAVLEGGGLTKFSLALNSAVLLWGMLLYVAAPFFFSGFLSRLVVLKLLSLRQ